MARVAQTCASIRPSDVQNPQPGLLECSRQTKNTLGIMPYKDVKGSGWRESRKALTKKTTKHFPKHPKAIIMHYKTLQRLIIKWKVEGFLLEICFVYNFLSLAVGNNHRRATSMTIAKKSAFHWSRKESTKERKKKQCNSTCNIISKSQPCPILHSDFENHRYLRTILKPRSGPGVPI